ncbi:hypothetical protein GW17_00058921 [Ensete ventricosum]|nr:hypothetical protein GW17_00058921 [Ensete ventricosum]
MEAVGECIAKILSEHVASQTRSKRIGKVQSVLCLRKYESHHSRNNMRELSDPKSLHSHALSLHISGDDDDFCIRRSEGSAIFGMPAGDILVTIGKPLQRDRRSIIPACPKGTFPALKVSQGRHYEAI